MTKMPVSFSFLPRSVAATSLVATSLVAIPVTLWNLSALASPAKSRSSASAKTRTRLAALPAASRRSGLKTTAQPAQLNPNKLPRYVSMATIKRLQKQARNSGFPIVAGLQPFWEGHALKSPMHNLLSGPAFDAPKAVKTLNGQRLAQNFPRPVAPASPRQFRRPGAATVTPKWVRYPLEFQLAGIALGTRAVDKDRFNRIDRYGLFALHGNPTAVVRSLGSVAAGGGAAGGGAAGGEGGAPGGRGGRGGPSLGGADGAPGGVPGGADGSAAAGGATAGTNVTLQQTPPETATLFPQAERGGGLPGWALAVTVKLDNNHVEWLYKRETYAMGFVVDRLGFVDAVIVAGITSDIATTQLEDPLHTVKLGDDLRKVLFRYGYPDDLVPLAADPAGTVDDTTGAPGGGGGGGGLGRGGAAIGGADTGGLGGPPAGVGGVPGGADGGAGGAAAGGGTNGAFRTYDLRYEQSYNVVFTIRNNRVVRVYIFGDPDFFNAQRRNQLRTKY